MKYVEPEIEIFFLDTSDIISTSDGGFAPGFEDDDGINWGVDLGML